jgi:hypothetical protein
MAVTPRLALPEPQSADAMNVNPPAFKTLFQNLDKSVNFTVCTSVTKPATPFSYQLIYCTDTNQMIIWDAVASAWIVLRERPKGIVGVTAGGSPVSVTASGTKYMGANINNVRLEGLKNYRIHIESAIDFTSNKTVATQNTSVGEVFLHTDTSGTATTASAATHVNYQDVYCSVNASAQRGHAQFAMEVIFQPPSSQVGSANLYGLGWSFQFGTALPPNSSVITIQNTLFYVENV